MSRLTNAEKEQHRRWLSDWRAPSDMAAYVGAVNDKMGSADFFRQPGVEFLRDAWLAAEFGRHRQSSLVRLVAEREQWPDFEARTSGFIERVERCEANVPGRRRGEEYRNVIDGELDIKHYPEEEIIDNAKQVSCALCLAISKKTFKIYDKGASLLVHLNIMVFGTMQEEIEMFMHYASLIANSHFNAVWIIWNDRLYGSFPPPMSQKEINQFR